MKRRIFPHRRTFIEEIRVKQKSTVWPYPLINNRRVDKFLWKGSSDAPLIQRIGAWVFGLAFLAMGALLLIVGREFAGDGGEGLVIMSVGAFMLGMKIFLNGFRRRKQK